MTLVRSAHPDQPQWERVATAVGQTLGLPAFWLWSLLSMHRRRPGQRRPAWARPQRLLLGAAAAFVLLLLLALFADPVTAAIQRSWPRWSLDPFYWITDFGRSHWVLVPTGAIIVAVAATLSMHVGRWSQLVLMSIAVRAGYLFAAVGVTGLVVHLVKNMIGRARPMRSPGQFDFVPFDWQAQYASFPSGHTTTVFAAAFALGALFPRWRVAFWGGAVVLGVSRVFVGMHFPSDVLGGALAGTLGAIAVRNWFAVMRLGFVVATDRSVKTLPGPSFRRVSNAVRVVLSR
jgi:membrane-associated phospholipid phosphatase